MKYIWLVTTQIFFGMCILKIGVSWSNLTVRTFFQMAWCIQPPTRVVQNAFFSSTRCFTAISGLGHMGELADFQQQNIVDVSGCIRVEKRAFKFETIWNFMNLLKVVAIRNHIFLRKDVYTLSTFYMMLFESLLHIIKQIHLSNLYVESKQKNGENPPLTPRLATSLAGASFNAWNLMVLMVRQRFFGGRTQKKPRWRFQTFFIFIPTWGRFPIWLIFFRWVETTN